MSFRSDWRPAASSAEPEAFVISRSLWMGDPLDSRSEGAGRTGKG